MSAPWEMIAREGFQFFGKMSASLSHEIKNALAILNENAGLLGDLTLLAGQGRPLDPERVKTLAARMGKQIERADMLVKRMNRFSHSADVGFSTVDLALALEPLVDIAQRPASLKEAQVSIVRPDHPVPADTYLFLLENLIWLSIDYLLSTGQKEIQLAPQATGAGARILVSAKMDLSRNLGQVFPSRKEIAIAEALRADLFMDSNAGEITIFLPKIV